MPIVGISGKGRCNSNQYLVFFSPRLIAAIQNNDVGRTRSRYLVSINRRFVSIKKTVVVFANTIGSSDNDYFSALIGEQQAYEPSRNGFAEFDYSNTVVG